jgi:hypothetical protein
MYQIGGCRLCWKGKPIRKGRRSNALVDVGLMPDSPGMRAGRLERRGSI